MFGFSLQKLIFTGLVIVVVIYGFKAIQRLQERRNAAENDRGAPGPGAGARVKAQTSAPVAQPEQGTEDMVACRVCGTFVAASGTRSCGREDCPYPG